jgi:hypothetical protein
MFLLLFAVYFMVKVLDVRVPTNLEGFSFSLSFVRPSPHTANQLFSGVRFSPPPPDALVTVHTHYPSSTTHSTIIFNNSYCIFLLSLNKKNFTFPILFISGWQNNPTVIWNVFIFDSTCFCCWMIGLRLNGTAGCNLSWPCVKNQNRKKSRGGQLPARALRPTTPWRLKLPFVARYEARSGHHSPRACCHKATVISLLLWFYFYIESFKMTQSNCHSCHLPYLAPLLFRSTK